MKHPINKQSLFAVALLFLALYVNQANGQSLSLFDLDISNFPTIKAKFYALDAEGNQILNLSPLDFELLENGVKRNITKVTCPTPAPPVAISSVLTVDVSGSMSGRVIANAKAACTAWIQGLPLGKSECAITAFDDKNFIVQDFTTDKSKLLEELEKLNAYGGTDYDMALLNPMAGGLLIAQKAKFKRVLIIITDGMPNHEPKTDMIIQEAKSLGVIVYGVTLNMPCPPSIKKIATQTGGLWFENITTTEQAEEVYRKIMQVAQGADPCEIEWESEVPCIGGLTNLELEIKSSGTKATTSYQSHISSVAKLEFNPATVKFLNPKIGIKVEKTVTVTAMNKNFTVTNITSNNKAFMIEPTNFVLKIGESRELVVSYTPTDSSYNFCKFVIESEPCPTEYYASGGYKGKKPTIQTLKLTHPNGGETFVVGSDTIITWEGIPPSDKVLLEYSTDNGQNWQTITHNASELNFKWTNIPRPLSSQCLVRVSQGDGILNSPAPQIEWQKAYGGSNHERAYSIQLTSDGGFIVTGYSESNNGDITENKGASDFWVLKLKFDGSIEWQKTYGGIKDDAAYSIQETSDGGYIVVGFTRSRDGDVTVNKSYIDYNDLWVLKLTYDGVLEWQKTYGGNWFDSGESIQQTEDGGYIVVGHTQSTNGDVTENKGGYDVWVLKLDLNGSIEWQKNYGGTSHDKAYSIIETRDGSYIVTGYTESNDYDITYHKGGQDAWVLKLNIDGSIAWQNTYGGFLNDIFYSIIETDDNGFIVAGTTELRNSDITVNKGVSDALIIKLKFDGSLEWQKTVGGSFNDFAYSIIESADSGFIVVGGTESRDGDVTENKGSSDAWIFKLSDDGSLEWQKTFGGSKIDIAYSVQETSGGGFIIAGWTDSNDKDVTVNLGAFDFWVVKLFWPTILQSDVSDAVFSIVEPKAASRDIDMLQVLVGSLKDSVVSEFIMNTGSWKFRVNSIYIQGADASAFSLVSGFPKYTIESNQSHHAEFRFIPNRVGLHSAEIVIVTQAETIIQNIIGEGVEPKLQIVNSLIDFGTIYVGEMIDTLQAVTVKNIGNAPFEILDTKHNYPNDVDFSTLAGGGNFILQPGEEALMDLRFSANSPGRTSGTLEFHYEGVGSPAVVQLFGEGIIDSDSSAITLEVLDAEGYASDAVKVYIVVTDSYLMQISRTESFSLELNFNPSLLYPLDFTMDYIDERNAKIKIEDLPVDVETGDTLATIWFRAGLGNAEISKLDLTNIEAIGGNTTITHKDGTFKLLGICYEGGTRLFNANSKAGIASVNPNPAENILEVDLQLNEEGQTELLIYNIQGEKVKELFKQSIATLGVQKLKSDISDLSSGQYYLVLITPTYIATKNLVIMR
ncbi:MAG: choice-of-anchor D domain-containing protein [Candidatus Kapabacteria bacterium]|nr:choice-of-anchor D domain-containing protein [Candidatus Kapabacteria bacterium]